MLIWLNGPFGAGKSSAAEALRLLRPNLVLFDTEQIGYALEHALAARLPVAGRRFSGVV